MSLSDTALSASNWFVVQLKPNGLALATRNLQRQRFNVFTPRRRETLTRPGRQVAACQPLFPGYSFVRVDPGQGRWGAINCTRGVSRLILGDPRNPRSLPEQFMAGLLSRCSGDGVLLPPEALSAGDRVRILSGPFAQFVTTVESLAVDDRLRVLVEIMGRQARLSLATGDVERIAEVT